jgi:hypothetical protein
VALHLPLAGSLVACFRGAPLPMFLLGDKFQARVSHGVVSSRSHFIRHHQPSGFRCRLIMKPGISLCYAHALAKVLLISLDVGIAYLTYRIRARLRAPLSGDAYCWIRPRAARPGTGLDLDQRTRFVPAHLVYLWVISRPEA